MGRAKGSKTTSADLLYKTAKATYSEYVKKNTPFPSALKKSFEDIAKLLKASNKPQHQVWLQDIPRWIKVIEKRNNKADCTSTLEQPDEPEYLLGSDGELEESSSRYYFSKNSEKCENSNEFPKDPEMIKKKKRIVMTQVILFHRN